MRAGDLDRRVQVLRAAAVDDGLQSRPGDFVAHGGPVWASRRDVSDGEAQRMGTEAGTLTSRFQIRRSRFADGITIRDRLTCDGLTYEIVGIKQIDGRAGLEITATARV
jgi:head-tail adaptor